MPIQSCSDGGKSGYRWGESGKCYTYPAGDKAGQKAAKKKAINQALAITGGKMTEQFKPPESGDAPKGVKDILKGAYDNCRSAWVKDHPQDKENKVNKQKCSQIAWAAVKNAGWKQADGKWKKEGMAESEDAKKENENNELWPDGESDDPEEVMMAMKRNIAEVDFLDKVIARENWTYEHRKAG